MSYRNTVTQIEPFEDYEKFRLKKTVFLGYTDVAAGGIRALLGIDMKKEFLTINLPELRSAKLACEAVGPLDPREQSYAPFQVWNLKYEQFSVILVNTKLPAEKCHYVCSKILDLCTESNVTKLIVLSALRVDIATEESTQLYENVINDMPLTKNGSLPADTKMNDPFLSTLIQMIQVDYVPTCILTIPAHRVCTGAARDTDGSLQIYKGDNEEKSSSVSMIYS
ncbi:hypothetical protein ACF0H5_019776 [Mactra antiquata]